MKSVYEQLMVEIARIKLGNKVPREELYRMYGKCQMARQLDRLTLEEFVKLNHEVVAEGINNPKYF